MAAEDRQIGVFADLDRADAAVESQLAGRVERDCLQRVIGMHIAVPHGLGGFEVQVPNQLPIVALDDDVGPRLF